MLFILIIFIVVVFFSGVAYFVIKHPISSFSANETALKLSGSGDKVVFTCAYTTIGYCLLELDSTSVRCMRADKIVFEIPYSDIQTVNTSYWAITFVTIAQQKYAISMLHKPMDNMIMGAETRGVVATEPATLREFEQFLTDKGVNHQRKLTLQKHLIIALFGVLFCVLLIIYVFLARQS